MKTLVDGAVWTSRLHSQTMSHDPREHSRVLLDGPNRAPSRAMLKAIGFTDEDLSMQPTG